MPKASPLKRVGGKLASAKSKTGNPACSKAMSDWVRNRKGGTVPQGTYSILAKCRAQSRQNKQATAKQAAGKLAPGRGTWQRSEAASALLAKRAARNAAKGPDLPTFAGRVNDAVARVPASKRVGSLVWVHHAHAEYERKHGPMPLDQFKAQLSKSVQARHLDMSRADMPEGFKPGDVQASKIDHNGGTFNFIRSKPSATPNAPAKAKPSASERAAALSARLGRAGAKTPTEKGQLAYQRAKQAGELKRQRAASKATAARAAESSKHDELFGRLNKIADQKLKRATNRLAKAEAEFTGKPTASKANAPAPPPERIATKALSAFHQLARGKTDHSGNGVMVPVHEIRRKIHEELGPQAASPAHFDKVMKQLRADGKIRLLGYSDARDFTEMQERDMIPAGPMAGSPFAWVMLT